jgi:hypothetical protein
MLHYRKAVADLLNHGRRSRWGRTPLSKWMPPTAAKDTAQRFRDTWLKCLAFEKQLEQRE